MNLNRRHFLSTAAGGFAGLALTDLLARDGMIGVLHHPPRAKRVVQLFMGGAASHVDLFDYKPQLEKEHGKQWDPGEEVELFQSSPGASAKSYWDFKPRGGCGKPLSDIVAPLGDVADDMAFIHNLIGQTGVHSQGTLLQTTGFNRPGFPSAGSWVSYALGSVNDNLPAFVVLPDHRGLASNGVKNWSAMFLPAESQGTIIRPGDKTPINDLFPPEESKFITKQADKDGLALLNKLNSQHALERLGDSRLQARIHSYELAARMQLSATEALQVDKEPQYIKDLYGLAPEGRGVNDSEINIKAETEFFGRKCLVARRLLERGVRFVQVWSGNENGHPRRNWDSHEDITRDHGPLASGMATGAAALIKDLKQRGLLDETLVIWGGEFGRTPMVQALAAGGETQAPGRDHHKDGFSIWMAGGGVKAGYVHGATDEFGFRAIKDPVHVHDFHATVLHLLGLDHTKLTFRSQGRDFRLTDVHGKVVNGLLA